MQIIRKQDETSLYNDNDKGLFIKGFNSFNFSVWNYTKENINEAKHTSDLIKSDYITAILIIK